MSQNRLTAFALITAKDGHADEFIAVAEQLYQTLVDGNYVEFYSWSRETLDPRTKEPITSNRFLLIEVHPSLEVAMTQRDNPKLAELGGKFMGLVESVEQLIGETVVGHAAPKV